MDYIYIGKFSIKNMNMTNDEIYEISLHLNNYKNMYGLPENICIKNTTQQMFTREKYMCDYGMCEYKKKILTYIIFQTSGIITFCDNTKECEPYTIVIFPSEWFFSFKISACIINIGNVFVDI